MTDVLWMYARCTAYVIDTCTFFFNDPPTTETYTLSLHDALPISRQGATVVERVGVRDHAGPAHQAERRHEPNDRSEEHTSELQSHSDLVCRLLLEKKKYGMAARRKRDDELST